MSDVLEPALAPIRTALRRLATRVDAKPTLRQGTVTSTGPVRVQLDGDTAPTPLTPRLLTPVAPGARVTVAHTGRDLTILGVVGGGTTPWHDVEIRSGYTGNSLYGPARYRIEHGRTLVLDVYINKTGSDFATLDEPFAVPVSLPSARYFLVYGDTNVGRGRLTTDGRMQLFNAISGSYLSTNMARIPLD